MMTKPLKTSLKKVNNTLGKMEQLHQCKFCNVKFHKGSTLATHMCVKKRRYMDIESQGSRFGFRAFQRFYDLTTSSKKPKTKDEFINSQFYSDFSKFGNHLSNLKPIHIEKFIEFVIMGQVKLKDWTKDEIYYLYIQNLIHTEPPDSAVERTILEMESWSNSNGSCFASFFHEISANEAAHLIRCGRISPWVVYLSTSGASLLKRFSEDHSKMIGAIIDAGLWMRKFKKQSDDVGHITTILTAAGL